MNQLPQNLLARLLLCFWPEEKRLDYKGVAVHINSKFPSGISLGDHVILKRYPFNKDTWDSVKHEYGHHCQSVKWGWLYLIVIGIPSLCGNIFDRIFHKKWDYARRRAWYFSQPWEASADKNGGVER